VSIEPGQQARPDPEGRPGTGRGPVGPQDIERTGRRALWLGLAAVLLMFIPVLSLLSPVCAVAALVFGVRARRASRRTGNPAPGAMPGIVFGAFGVAFFVLGFIGQMYLLNEIRTYDQCRRAANTIEDERVCKERLARDIEKKFGLEEGTLKPENLPL